MNVKLGCDLISLKRFHEAVLARGEDFLHKVFFMEEIKLASSVESLAGYFALKEAVFKALGFKGGDWHFIKIIKHASGKPGLEIFHPVSSTIISYDVSISHDNGMAIAISCFLMKDSYDVN